MQISASGMQAAQTLFDTSAYDIANVSNPAHHEVRPELAAGPGRSGVAVTGITAAAQPGVDLAAEMVALSTARLAYTANAGVAVTVAETQRSLLDVFA